jgi:hypothetical protein
MGVLGLLTWYVVITTHDANRHNTLIHNFLSTAPQLTISQKTQGTLLEDGNVMPKHVGATIHNKLNELIGVFVGFSHILLLEILIFKGSLHDVFVSRSALMG